MTFLLKIPKKPTSGFVLVEKDGEPGFSDQKKIYLRLDAVSSRCARQVEVGDSVFIIVGDFIIPLEDQHNEEKYLQKFFKGFKPEKLRESRGHFHIVQIDDRGMTCRVFSSMMSILPVYWFDAGDCFLVSSRMESIVRLSKRRMRIDKAYILEHLLFGYGFQERTIFEGIKLLPTNHYIEYSGSEFRITSHTRIADFFVTDPKPWRDTLNPLSDLFIERAGGYLPDEPYYSSLTGGLDGRTLLALGFSLGREMKTYSYGSADERDVVIPSKISRKIGVEYHPFILNKAYAERAFMRHAECANLLTEGNIRFSRATYNLLSETLSRETRFIVTGNFGSELMRTMRIAGNVTSHMIFDLFESKTEAEAAEKIKVSPKLRYIQLDSFKNEIDAVTETWINYRRSFKENLTLNQRFYTFMFEEVFRKYFGPEIVLEHHYLINRTPFLDFAFMKELFKSELAGCNGGFRVRSPFDRFKGQALYPLIIKKTYPKLLNFRLDKAYTPGDFLHPFGKMKIAMGYTIRRYVTDKHRSLLPNYCDLAFDMNFYRLKHIKHNYTFMNTEKFAGLFRNSEWKSDFINFNIAISLLHYLNHVLKEYSNVEMD